MIQYSTVHFSPLLSNVLHHKTYHYSILVGYNNYIYYTDQQTTRTLGKYTLVYRPVAGLRSEEFGFRFLVIQNECPEGTSYPRGSRGMLSRKIVES